MAEKLSGVTETGISLLVNEFYAKARRDPMIGPLFESTVEDWNAHLAKLAAFWSSVMLTTGRYSGNPMAVHRRHPIVPEQFDRWLELWRETTRELFDDATAERFIAKAERIGESLKMALFVYGNDPLRARPAAHVRPIEP